MSPILVEYPHSNGGPLLLAGATVIGPGGFGASFWVGEDDSVLI